MCRAQRNGANRGSSLAVHTGDRRNGRCMRMALVRYVVRRDHYGGVSLVHHLATRQRAVAILEGAGMDITGRDRVIPCGQCCCRCRVCPCRCRAGRNSRRARDRADASDGEIHAAGRRGSAGHRGCERDRTAIGRWVETGSDSRRCRCRTADTQRTGARRGTGTLAPCAAVCATNRKRVAGRRIRDDTSSGGNGEG